MLYCLRCLREGSGSTYMAQCLWPKALSTPGIGGCMARTMTCGETVSNVVPRKRSPSITSLRRRLMWYTTWCIIRKSESLDHSNWWLIALSYPQEGLYWYHPHQISGVYTYTRASPPLLLVLQGIRQVCKKDHLTFSRVCSICCLILLILAKWFQRHVWSVDLPSMLHVAAC